MILKYGNCEVIPDFQNLNLKQGRWVEKINHQRSDRLLTQFDAIKVLDYLFPELPQNIFPRRVKLCKAPLQKHIVASQCKFKTTLRLTVLR